MFTAWWARLNEIDKGINSVFRTSTLSNHCCEHITYCAFSHYQNRHRIHVTLQRSNNSKYRNTYYIHATTSHCKNAKSQLQRTKSYLLSLLSVKDFYSAGCNIIVLFKPLRVFTLPHYFRLCATMLISQLYIQF